MAKKTKAEQAPVENGLKEQAVEVAETQAQAQEVAAEEVVTEDKYPGNATRGFRG
jgi:hypothetical protein